MSWITGLGLTPFGRLDGRSALDLMSGAVPFGPTTIPRREHVRATVTALDAVVIQTGEATHGQ